MEVVCANVQFQHFHDLIPHLVRYPVALRVLQVMRRKRKRGQGVRVRSAVTVALAVESLRHTQDPQRPYLLR